MCVRDRNNTSTVINKQKHLCHVSSAYSQRVAFALLWICLIFSEIVTVKIWTVGTERKCANMGHSTL